jgi:hypothetical protein
VSAAYVNPSTRAHLDMLTAGVDEGHLVLSTPIPERKRAGKTPWASWSFPIDEVDAAASCAAELDRQERNVYVRTNILHTALPASREGWSWKRGSGSQTYAVTALAADLDVAGPAHKQSGDGSPLPPDRAAAMSIVAELPPPSMLVDSGGGLHAWWLLDEPVYDDPAGLIGTWAERLEEAGRRRGWHVDKPDAARVLRACGTTRRKPGITPNRVTLVDVAGWPTEGLASRPWCPQGRYGASDLLEALPTPKPPAPPTPPRAGSRDDVGGGIGPADIVSEMTWAEILTPAGWEYIGTDKVDHVSVELWRRPDATSEFSIKCFPHGPAVAWSDACGLPAGKGQRLNKWKVYVALHGDGDPEGTARAIRRLSKEAARVR